jgi:hypothetical protein
MELCSSSTSQKPRNDVLNLTLSGVTQKNITTGQGHFDWPPANVKGGVGKPVLPFLRQAARGSEENHALANTENLGKMW